MVSEVQKPLDGQLAPCRGGAPRVFPSGDKKTEGPFVSIQISETREIPMKHHKIGKLDEHRWTSYSKKCATKNGRIGWQMLGFCRVFCFGVIIFVPGDSSQKFTRRADFEAICEAFTVHFLHFPLGQPGRSFWRYCQPHKRCYANDLLLHLPWVKIRVAVWGPAKLIYCHISVIDNFTLGVQSFWTKNRCLYQN